MTLPSKYRRPKPFSHLNWILGISAIITALVVTVFIQTMGVFSIGPIQKNLNLETRVLTREFVESKNGDTLEYLTTGPIFSDFSFYCKKADWGWLKLDPSLYCLNLTYHGKPGIVELYILRKFPNISNVAYGSVKWPIPYQILHADEYYTRIRIELPSSNAFNWHNAILIGGNERGPMPFLNPWLPWVVFLGIGTFIGCVFLLIKMRNRF